MPQGRDETPVEPTFQLGVLLVHGIGTHGRGETLVGWGDALIKTIVSATREGVVATGERAWLANSPGTGGAEAAVGLRVGDHTERWLLSECWWSTSFPPQSYAELVSWSVAALPWSIAIHIAEGYWQAASPEAGRGRGIVALTKALAELLVALVLAPVLIAFLALALLLGAIPIPQVRALVLRVQSALTGTVGQSLAFVESPVRAALIRTPVLEKLERLKRICTHTAIVAHSQGAAVVLDALGGFDVSEKEGPSASRPLPDALLTFGSGVNQLASLRMLASGRPATIAGEVGNPAYKMVAAVWATLGTVVGFCFAWRTDLVSPSDIRQAFEVSLLLWLLLTLFWGAQIARQVVSRWKSVMTALVWIIMLAVVPVALWFLFEFVINKAIWLTSALFSALSVGLASMRRIISSEMKSMVTALVRRPTGLQRWVDLYASADPVPNGPTRTADAGTLESIPIWNLGSEFADHTAYWDNRDGFVLRVARMCAETAKSPWAGALPRGPWTSALPREAPFVERRAAWRVRFLQLARWSTTTAWLVMFVVIAWTADRQEIQKVLSKLPAWTLLPNLPKGIAAAIALFVLLAALIALACWATSRLLRWLWTRWVREEQDMLLAHDQPTPVIGSSGRFALNAMATVFWMLLYASGLFAWGTGRLPSLGLGQLLVTVGLMIFSCAGLGIASAWALLKLRPGPRIASPLTPQP